MQAILISMGVVAVSELGDKTQLLALILASRFKKPVPVILGILTATLANHAVAAWVGEWTGGLMRLPLLHVLLGVLFLGMAMWSLIPDKMAGEDAKPHGHGNAYLVTVVSFFVAEIGDKTQIATAMLAARFHEIGPVLLGTTMGMLLADIPAVIGGHIMGNRINLRYARYASAAIYMALALPELLG